MFRGDLSAVRVILVFLLLPDDLGTRVPFPHRLTVMPIYLKGATFLLEWFARFSR